MEDSCLSAMVYVKVEDLISKLNEISLDESTLVGLRISVFRKCHRELLVFTPAPGGTMPQVLCGTLKSVF